MTLPFGLPDVLSSWLPPWLPPWVPIVVLVPVLLYALAFLFMPFSVIGLKGRLETMEARLDEIQGEIRSLALRLPEPIRTPLYDDPPAYFGPERFEREPVTSRPPIPPAPYYPDSEAMAERPRREGLRPRDRDDRPPPTRAEPRLDWPR
ncbi:MAG: hypothetical protein JO264_18095 [Acidisphaera sp.]|nr:hypothetical protein [Acidisphaera sp.]